MSIQQRVVARYAALMSKRQMAIIEVLKKGGRLEKLNRAIYLLVDKTGKTALTGIPVNTIDLMMSKSIIKSTGGYDSGIYVLNPKWSQKKLRKRPGPPDGAVGFVQQDVLGGAYSDSMQKGKEMLTHAVWVDDRGEWLGEKTVCNKMLLDRMADVGQDDLTCKTCATRVRKYKLPRMKRHESW